MGRVLVQLCHVRFRVLLALVGVNNLNLSHVSNLRVRLNKGHCAKLVTSPHFIPLTKTRLKREFLPPSVHSFSRFEVWPGLPEDTTTMRNCIPCLTDSLRSACVCCTREATRQT